MSILPSKKPASWRRASVADLLAVEREGRDAFGMRHEAAGDEAACRPHARRAPRKDRHGAGHDGLDIAGCCLDRPSFVAAARGFFISDALPGLRSSLGASLMQSHQTATFQISFAYWRMVRSEENQPMRATLRIALRIPVRAVAPDRVDLALRRGIGVEIGGDHEPVVLVEAVDQLAVALRIVGREHARRDRRRAPATAPAMPR